MWVWLAGGAALIVAVVATVVLGLRAQAPLIVNGMRRVNKAIFNPLQMRSAGTPGAYAAIVRHVGRTSGTSYETPVGAVATDTGFVVALPYGDRADWVRNVLAAGSATVVQEGHAIAVEQPRLVAMSQVAEQFPEAEQRTHRRFGVDVALEVRAVPT